MLVRRHRRAAESRGRQHRRHARGSGRAARRRARLSLPDSPGPASNAAAGPRARRARGAARAPGFIIDPAGLHPDQSPRHRRRRPHHGARWPTAAACARARSGPIRIPTSRSSRWTRRAPLPFAPLGDSDDAARRRVGARDRQSARPTSTPVTVGVVSFIGRKLFDSVARPLHPDRRRHQLRQQRRAAHQRARRSDRHQRRDQLARVEHRLRGADQPGDRDPAAAARERPRVARLHRRDADATSIRICSGRWASTARPARWCRTSPPARRARARAPHLRPRSSPWTARRCAATTSSFRSIGGAAAGHDCHAAGRARRPADERSGEAGRAAAARAPVPAATISSRAVRPARSAARACRCANIDAESATQRFKLPDGTERRDRVARRTR